MFDKITHHFITAIFNRVATGFILCFSEHFLCSPGIGEEPQQAAKPPIPPVAEPEVLGVCITKALLAVYVWYELNESYSTLIVPAAKRTINTVTSPYWAYLLY